MTYAEQTKQMQSRQNTGKEQRESDKQRETRDAFDLDLPNKRVK